MKHQLAGISVHQSAKVVAIVYGVLGLIVVPLFVLASLADPAGAFPLWLVLLFPVFYGIMGYVFTALAAALYNVIASRAGGIEFALRPVSDGDSIP